MWLVDWKLQLHGDSGTITMSAPFHPGGLMLLDGKWALRQRTCQAVPPETSLEELTTMDMDDMGPILVVCHFVRAIEGMQTAVEKEGHPRQPLA